MRRSARLRDRSTQTRTARTCPLHAGRKQPGMATLESQPYLRQRIWRLVYTLCVMLCMRLPGRMSTGDTWRLPDSLHRERERKGNGSLKAPDRHDNTLVRNNTITTPTIPTPQAMIGDRCSLSALRTGTRARSWGDGTYGANAYDLSRTRGVFDRRLKEHVTVFIAPPTMNAIVSAMNVPNHTRTDRRTNGMRAGRGGLSAHALKRWSDASDVLNAARIFANGAMVVGMTYNMNANAVV